MADVITVKMLETARGSPDGIHVNLYQAGLIYDLPDDLAHSFVHLMGVAVAADRFETPEHPAPSSADPRQTPEAPPKRGRPRYRG